MPRKFHADNPTRGQPFFFTAPASLKSRSKLCCGVTHLSAGGKHSSFLFFVEVPGVKSLKEVKNIGI
jgi:hypothetical protein